MFNSSPINNQNKYNQQWHIEEANFENLLIELRDYVQGIYEQGMADGIIERLEVEKRVRSEWDIKSTAHSVKKKMYFPFLNVS